MAVGTLIALTVSEGEDWKAVEMPGAEKAGGAVHPPTPAATVSSGSGEHRLFHLCAIIQLCYIHYMLHSSFHFTNIVTRGPFILFAPMGSTANCRTPLVPVLLDTDSN